MINSKNKIKNKRNVIIEIIKNKRNFFPTPYIKIKIPLEIFPNNLFGIVMYSHPFIQKDLTNFAAE